MATAHKRTLFYQLVGLNKQDETFHSMMESCASFETLGAPSVENNNERAARRTISSRVSQLKKKLGTAAKKRDTDSPREFLDGEIISISAKPKHSARSGSKSPAPRRGTGDTESQSDLDSVSGERKEFDDMANEKLSAINVDVDDSTKRKRRTFFGAFLLPGHNSNKTLDPQNSTKTLENDPAYKQHPLNESISSKQETHPLNQSLSSNHQNERHSLNQSLSTKQHKSPKKVRNKRPESEPSPSGEKRRSRKSTEKKKLESDSEQSHGNLRISHGKSLNQSKELEGEGELPSPLQESHRSSLDAIHTSLKKTDSAETETSVSPRRSPRSRKRSETESHEEKRKTRRSLSPRRCLKQPTSEGEGDNSKEAGLSPSKSPKKRGSSPRRRKISHELSLSRERTDTDLSLKTPVMNDEVDNGNVNAVNVESHLVVARAACDGNTSEQDERATLDKDVDAKAVNETSKQKGSDDNGVGESSHKGDVTSRERKSRQDTEKSPTRRSRSVTARVRTRHVSKSRDLSLSPDKQRNRSTRESSGEERRSNASNRVKDLCLKLEQASEKRPRGSSASLSPRKESSLKNMLDAATPFADRKCLTVVSPQDYEKKKKVRNGDDAFADQSLLTVTDTTKRILRRVSPKKSPCSRHRVATIPDILAMSPRRSTPTQKVATPLESSKSASKKSPSSSRELTIVADESQKVKEAERGLEDDARGRARHRLEQLKVENHNVQQRRPRSISRHKKERETEAPLEQHTAMVTHPESLSKLSDALNQSQSKSPRTFLKKVTRPSSLSKATKASPIALDDSQRDSTLRKSTIHIDVQPTEDLQPSQIKMSTHSMPEKSDVQRLRRPASKSPGRHATQIHDQRKNGQKGSGDIEKMSKRNEQLIRRVMSARNIDGHQSHHFEVGELTKSGTVVKRKMKVVRASDVETLGSMLLQKDTGRGTPKHKKGQASPVAAQLHIPDLDESQKSDLKVKYTEYNEISMLDNYVDDVEESDSVQ
jgi:hypothetical protein